MEAAVMGFGGSSGGNGSIASGTDVALSNVQQDHILGYDAGVSKWRNVIGAALPVSSTAATTSYTLILSDAGKAVEVTAAGATTLTVPSNTSVAFPVGTIIEVVQLGTGTVTLAGGSGVTLQSAGGLLSTRTQYSTLSIRKRTTNTWLVVGDAA